MVESQGIFDTVEEYPDPYAKERFASLVGIDKIKKHLLKEAQVMLSPKSLDDWSKKYYKKTIELVNIYRKRPPLVIFSGDVGTGKTELAKTFGDSVSRLSSLPVFLYSMSLSARGSGAVGEMTKLLSLAFSEIREVAQKAILHKKKSNSAYILLIDEADALAQSREFSQMHHEDRAGVNAVIRGIDSITSLYLPVMIIMCTNRLNALDPAIRRRATATFEFNRPSELQRKAVLKNGLLSTGVSDKDISTIANITGKNAHRNYGFTFSDITQRLLPSILLEAYPENAISGKQSIEIAKKIIPTPPFNEHEITIKSSN